MNMEYLFTKLMSTKKLFNWFGLRYNNEQIALLNDCVKTRNKICSLVSSNVFLKQCITNRVAPKFISKRITKSRLKKNSAAEKSFIMADISRQQQLIDKLKRRYSYKLNSARRWLSFCDQIRLLRYSTRICQRTLKFKSKK